VRQRAGGPDEQVQHAEARATVRCPRADHRQRAERDEPAPGLGHHGTNRSTSGDGRHVRRPGATAPQLRRAAVLRDPAHRVQPVREVVLSAPIGRRGSTTATTSSGTNSATRSSQIASTSTGAAVSIVRGVSRLEREKTVDSALGTAPRPVSTTSETSTGRAGPTGPAP
jgi:hypothetical protein